MGRTRPLEAAGRVLRDGGGEGRADLDVQFVARVEGCGGGGEWGDAVDEAGVVGVEVGEVEELG